MQTERQTINGYEVTFTEVDGPNNPRHETQNGLILTKPSRDWNPVDGLMPEALPCPACDGTGYREVQNAPESADCPKCDGEGTFAPTWAELVAWAIAEHGATTVIALDGPYDSGRYQPSASDSPDVDHIGGIVFDTAERREITGTQPIQMDTALRAEVTEYNAWADGDVWEYEIRDRNGDRVDEAGLNDMSNEIIGWDYALAEATMEAEHAGPQPAELETYSVRIEAGHGLTREAVAQHISDALSDYGPATLVVESVRAG